MGTRTRGLAALLGVVLSMAVSPARRDASVPVLVELFTSEGCSSCPPADQLLIDLIRAQPIAGARIIGLSEHVDYWDHQGWKDPFSNVLFTERQSAYGSTLHVGDIYTPQMVVDGARELVGQNRAAALAAITQAAATPKAPVHLSWTGGPTSALSVQAEPSAASNGGRVMLAITEDGLSSSVTRGENQGRRLTHAAVARRIADIGRADASGAFQKIVAVRLDPAWQRDRLHAVVFIQSARAALRVTAAGMVTIQ